MKLLFEITSGDREGSRFEIRDGASIGRKGTDIIIRDSKISSRHAAVEERDHGFYLVDAESSNGLKVEGNRLTEVHLLPGVVIQIGRTFLTVVDLDEVGDTPDKPLVRTWQESAATILYRVSRQLAESPFAPDRLKMFAKPIELSAVGGPQTGESWTLVYGPRDVGSESLDVRLLGDGIPPKAFEITSTNGRIMLNTEHADKITINGRSTQEGQSLNDGDEILIQGTKLRVKVRDL